VRRHRLATGRPRAGELVFADERGLPLDANGLPRYGWHRIRRVADEPLHRFRHLRHAWAAYSLRAGLRPEAVAQLGGRSDVAMVTLRYGRHALPDEVADAGALLEAWRGGWGRGG
jgi:integrase